MSTANKGKGTTFKIYLPLTKTKIREATPELMYPVASGTETVLLVEDEAEVRVFTKKLLEEFGYKVIEAPDGEAAVTAFKIHKDEIQLLILHATECPRKTVERRTRR